MGLTTILTAGLVGTTLMTIFSKTLGLILAKEFSEPKLLAELFSKQRFGKKDKFMGWLAHYLIGIFFAWGIWFYTFLTNGDYTYLTGMILGGLFGILGILGWWALMIVLKKPPQLDLPAFFIQLVFAHIVFGLGVILVFRNF